MEVKPVNMKIWLHTLTCLAKVRYDFPLPISVGLSPATTLLSHSSLSSWNYLTPLDSNICFFFCLTNHFDLTSFADYSKLCANVTCCKKPLESRFEIFSAFSLNNPYSYLIWHFPHYIIWSLVKIPHFTPSSLYARI